MYKKNLLLCLMLLLVLLSKAQIVMTLQVPPVGVLVKNQLWNMLLVNSGKTNQLIEISLVLSDQKTNEPVLTAVTTPFLLDKGARQIQAKDLGAINYTYNGPASLTDHDLQYTEGLQDELVGRIQKRTGETREAVEKALKEFHSAKAA